MAEPPRFHPFEPEPGETPAYSWAVEADRFVFLAGQVPNDPPHHRDPLPDDIESQTRLAVENLSLALGRLGLSLADLVQVRIYLTRFEAEFERMNAVYRNYFAAERLPARTCIGVTHLARGARIEIEGVALRR